MKLLPHWNMEFGIAKIHVSLGMVTQNGSRISLIPFKVRVVVLC